MDAECTLTLASESHVNYGLLALQLAKRIRDARERAGLTQQQLGERCGLSRVYINNLESGQHDNPTIKVLDAIAKALKVRVTDLIS